MKELLKDMTEYRDLLNGYIKERPIHSTTVLSDWRKEVADCDQIIIEIKKTKSLIELKQAVLAYRLSKNLDSYELQKPNIPHVCNYVLKKIEQINLDTA